MDCKFVVGQRVVCVREDAWMNVHSHEVGPGPTKGQVCTITSIDIFWNHAYLSFCEWPTMGYDHMDFSPVHERKIDISIFTAILDKANQRQTERV